jgi:hypothetical protein
VRTLAGVTSAGRPLFLKVVYHGPQALEELVRYDPHLIVGILGGSAGTTYDAFKLLSEAKKYGARVALFGRKINNAENQLAFIRFLRLIADGEITAEEAVRAYHGVLQKLGIRPHRSLTEDMELRSGIMSYGGSDKVISIPRRAGVPEDVQMSSAAPSVECHCSRDGNTTGSCSCPTRGEPPPTERSAKEAPDFTKMTHREKVAYHLARWNRILG